MQFEIGDLIIMELALATYFKDFDLSLSCAKQIQGTIAKLEYQIAQIQSAYAKQGSLNLQADPKNPTNK